MCLSNTIFYLLGELFRETWDSAYVYNGGMMQNFFSVFAVYFPAGIGILAGANVSGDLQVYLKQSLPY